MELADRRLTAMDVMAKLELKRTALVYLGSCDSGRAVPGRTDELMALVRVFLYAGSPTVIASLWELHEGAGNTFADYFYNFWMSEGEPMAVAFQKAILRLKNRKVYSNPFCWAPFVLMGAWNAKEVTNNEQT
jgi:CHAT domain-containing protein